MKALSVQNLVDQYYKKLNPEQKRAVDAMIKSWSNGAPDEFIFPVIDGPPGTGKTHIATLACAKYLLQCTEEGKRGEVVYLCKTNVACERARKKFIELGFKWCPPGLPVPQDELLVAQLVAGKGPQWNEGVVYCSAEIPGPPDWDRLVAHHVLIVTVDSAQRVHECRKNPKIVLDEFSQINALDFFAAVERVCRGKVLPHSFTLLGDPIQLPVVTTQPFLRPNVFSTISQLKPGFPRHELKLQYRMHGYICEVVNAIRRYHYHTYPLDSYKGVKNRTLEAFGFVPPKTSSPLLKKVLDPDCPVVLLDTSLLGDEKQGLTGSWLNSGEAHLAAKIVEHFAKGSTRPAESIKVLTPYSAQVEQISSLLPKFRQVVSTIYSAQGQEWPCVVISFVRNNDERKWGFLGDRGDLDLTAQIYVGVSRAQAKLVVLAAYERTFKEHPDIEPMWGCPHVEIIPPSEVKKWSST
ncbi:MAG: AAA domain-containing protein [Candidatus Hadarchaeales archaeon]